MAAIEVLPPFPIFADTAGDPLDAGYIFIGAENTDPVTNPIAVYWDAGLTIPASQPIRTIGGYPSRSGSPSAVFASDSYSITVKDSAGRLIYASLSSVDPLREDLADSSDQAKGDALVAVKLIATGSSARTQHDKNADNWNVKDFGATGDGVTDDTVSIAACIAAAKAAKQSVTTGVNLTSSSPTVHFPKGVYVVSSAFTADTSASISYMNFTGDSAILKVSSGIIPFQGVGAAVTFKGIQFHGGFGCWSIKTGNADGAIIAMDDCVSIGQTGDIWAIDSTSQSTELTVRNCRVFAPAPINDAASTRILYALSGDYKLFRDCFFETCGVNAAFYNKDGRGFLTLDNCILVPTHTVTKPPAWVDNYGVFRARNTRFGGEAGGTTYTVRNYASADTANPVNPNGVILESCEIYVNSKIIQFFAIPNFAVIRDPIGLIPSVAGPTWFALDASVPSADLANVGSDNNLFIIDSAVGPVGVTQIFDPTIGDARGILGLPLANPSFRKKVSCGLQAGSVVINSSFGTGLFGPTNAGTATPTATNDLWGAASQTITGTANGQYMYPGFTTFLNGIAAGVYTVCVAVDMTTNHAVKARLRCGNASSNQFITRGLNVLTMPFYHDGGAAQTMKLEVEGIPNGCVYQLGRMSLYIGEVTPGDRRMLIEGASAPAAGAWLRGDRCINSTPAVGQPKAWICTVAGSPGTWTSEGNL